MKQGRSIIELAQELERQKQNKKDFKAPTTMLSLAFDGKNVEVALEGKGNFHPTNLMHDQLGSYVGIPSKYYDRMLNEEPELLATNVNRWLHKEKETRLVRTLDGNARAFLSNRYRTIDNHDVAEATLPVLLNETKTLGAVEVVSSQVTENRLYIKATTPRLSYDIKVGDTVQAGIIISNSEVGLGSVKVEPFLYRLVCQNGAVIADSAVRKFHIGRHSDELEAAYEVFRDDTRRADDKAFMMKLQDVVRGAFDQTQFNKLKGLTIDATTRKVEKPIEDLIEEVAVRYQFSDSHKDSFLKNLINGGDTTQWGVANAVTAMANTADDYEVASRLERVGGELLVMDGKAWHQLAA